jgi:hypothetical protein
MCGRINSMSHERGQDHDVLLEGFTVNEAIKPDLTAREWIRRYFGDGGLTFTATTSTLLIDAGEFDVAIPRRQALAALALYGQPSGFTRRDVAILREIAEDEFGPYASEERQEFASLADRIEALLPPEK